jgi:hypothetical protein
LVAIFLPWFGCLSSRHHRHVWPTFFVHSREDSYDLPVKKSARAFDAMNVNSSHDSLALRTAITKLFAPQAGLETICEELQLPRFPGPAVSDTVAPISDFGRMVRSSDIPPATNPMEFKMMEGAVRENHRFS